MRKFGEKVEGYNIPVLNEREIRASAGILFQFMFVALMLIIFKESFILIKYIIIFFLSDFIIRVFINPKYAPSLILGRIFVKRQSPEYVGAAQKKFAWIIGVILASIMFVLMVLMNTYSIITGLICMICLIFLFFESAFGICLGCIFYGWFYKEKVQLCAGEICDIKQKHDIQKVTFLQIGIIVFFIAFIVASVILFKENFSDQPISLWDKINVN